MVMIGAAQRRFLVFTSTVFFVASLYFCVNRLLSTTSLSPSLQPPVPVATKVFEVPEIPEASEAPKAHETSTAPKAHETSTAPKAPEAPEAPEKPEKPEIPEAPEKPEIPEAPENPEIPEAPSKPLPSIHVEFSKADLPMSFGTFARPAYDGINMLAELPNDLVPTEANGRRLIVIGDIHGMIDPLNELLEKTEFDLARDHIISVGDMVNKGPKSFDVVSRLMELKASAVRGNHEDRVLVAWTAINEQQGVQALLDSDFAAQQRGESLDRKTARSLNDTQIQWLRKLPVILTVDPMSTYIVHAGLVPSVSLAQQDPWAVMNMRTMRFPRVEFREEEETKRRKAEEKKKQEEEKKKQEEEEAKKKQEFQQRGPGPVKRNRHKRDQGSEDFDRSAEAGFLKAAASAAATSSAEGSVGENKAASSTSSLIATSVSASNSASTSILNAEGAGEARTAVDPETGDKQFTATGVTSPESTLLTQPDHDIWIPVDTRVGEPWSNVWNHFQKKVPKSERRSIIYGHDAHRGYQEDSYSFGLDSGCVKGNTLTALVIEARNGGWSYKTVDVECTAP